MTFRATDTVFGDPNAANIWNGRFAPTADVPRESALDPKKTVFDQERPDRLTVRGHWRGIPFSGNRLDAFPSGHAVHIGALASAASILPAKQRNAAWGIGLGLVLTRIILLAHWTSDAVVGLGVGVLTERILRCFTGYGRKTNAVKASGGPPQFVSHAYLRRAIKS
jgi:membrane-associated phospholipid phosphatase